MNPLRIALPKGRLQDDALAAFAAAGYYVVAPDCRGFGRTSGWDHAWDADPTPFLMLNMVRDQIALGNLRTSAQTAVGMLMSPGPRNDSRPCSPAAQFGWRNLSSLGLWRRTEPWQR